MSSCARSARFRTLSAVILLIAPARPLHAADPPKGPSHVDTRLNPSVMWAAAMAAERLSSQACAAVLLDFSDVRTGRPLSENLAATGQSAAGYLARSVAFRDGEGIGLCRLPTTAAFTTPGSRVIYICRGRFAKEQKRDQGLAANILVHETLHSLGLGENPPTPEEISHRIHERCGI
jgi:hypothetical protein